MRGIAHKGMLERIPGLSSLLRHDQISCSKAVETGVELFTAQGRCGGEDLLRKILADNRCFPKNPYRYFTAQRKPWRWIT